MSNEFISQPLLIIIGIKIRILSFPYGNSFQCSSAWKIKLSGELSSFIMLNQNLFLPVARPVRPITVTFCSWLSSTSLKDTLVPFFGIQPVVTVGFSSLSTGISCSDFVED